MLDQGDLNLFESIKWKLYCLTNWRLGISKSVSQTVSSPDSQTVRPRS